MDLKKWIFISGLLIIISSCEEVVNINLNDSNPAFMAEGSIIQGSVCTLKLNQTSNFFDSADPKAIEDAYVILEDNSGLSEQLIHTGNGNYKGTNLTGKAGSKYRLSILLGEEEYSGESYMTDPPEIVRLIPEKLEPPHYVGEDIYNVNCVFLNNLNEDNYYLAKYYRNGELISDYYSVFDDSFLVSDTVVFSDFRMDFMLNDTVDIELYSIDETLYDYYNLVNDVLFSAMSSSTPFNPTSNLSNGALGYFMAASFDRKRLIIRNRH